MMFSSTEQSRSKNAKRGHSELEQFTPDELTDGLNRLSVRKHQKLARKLAQDFVQSESGLLSLATPEQLQGESIRFTDFLVQTTVDKHPTNLSVLAAAQKYRDLPQTPAARAEGLRQFEIETQPHIEQAQTVSAGFELAHATSNICQQVALISTNKGFRSFATGLGAMTQATQGVYQISQASALMSQAANGAMTMASGAMMLGAVGAVIAAGVMIYGMCSEEEDAGNGLGEALEAIHSAVMGMWEDTRRNFELVFEKLDVIDEKITEMERQNWKRFVAQMRAIHHYGESTRAQINDLKTVTQGHFQHLQDGMRSYLNELSDETAITMLDTIRLEGSEETIKHLSERIPQLAYWLNNKATIKYHAGRIDAVDVDSETLTRELKKTITEDTIESLSYPLGLFASIARDIDQTTLPKEALTQMINTQDWNRVLACYLDVIRLALPTISTLDSKQQDAYLDITQKIKNKPLLILEFLSNLIDSDTLWTTLVHDYQQAVIEIQAQISMVLEEQQRELHTTYDFDDHSGELVQLNQSAEENIIRVDSLVNLKTRLTKDLEPHQFLAKQAILENACDDSLGRSLIASNDYYIRDWLGDCYPTLTGEARYLTDSQIRGLLDTHSGRDRLMALFQHPSFLLAHQFKLAALHISSYGERKSQDTFVHISISILNEEKITPLYDMQFPVFYDRLYNYTPSYVEPCDNILPTLHKVIHWAAAHHASMDTLPMGMRVESIVLDPEYQLAKESKALGNTIENNILKPARKLAGEKIRINMQQFECARLRLLSFIKLLNPGFEIDLAHALNSIQDLVRDIQRTGEVEPLQQLLNPNFGANLLQQDLGFPITLNPSQTELVDLVKIRVKQQPAYQHPLWQTMAYAYASIEILEQKLIQVSRMQPTAQDKIEETLCDGMVILNKHHQRFSEGLERMRSVIEQAQGLRLVSESRLTKVTDILNLLETQFAPAVNAATDLNDDINAGYSAPEHKITPTPSFTLSEEKRVSLGRRWVKRTKSTKELPLSETVVLLEGVIQSFGALPKTAVPAVVLVGCSQVGKSTLANALHGVLYQSALNELRRPCVEKRITSTVEEFAPTGRGVSSTTLFPNMRLSQDETCYWVDMPGYHENRGKAQQISTGIAFQCLQQHCQTMKGIVIVCDENELLSNGYATLRTTLENVGRMLPAFTDDAKAHVLLAVMHSRGEITQDGILDVLKMLLATEYSSVIGADKRAVKRALLYLTQSIERISLVDVTHPESVAALTRKINALPVSEMSQFNLTPTSDLMELFKKLMKTIVSAEHELRTRIEQLQAVLKHQFKSQLLATDMSVSADLVGCQKKLKTMLAHMNQEEHQESFEFTCLVDEQHALAGKATEFLGTLSQLLNTKSHTTVVSQAKISAEEELIEKYAELEENQAFFSRMAEIAAMLSDSRDYETDDEAMNLLDEDTTHFLSDNGMTLIYDEQDEGDEEASDSSIWVKPDDTPGLRIVRPAYHAVAKTAGFTRFFQDKGYTVTEVDEDVSVQLNKMAISTFCK